MFLLDDRVAILHRAKDPESEGFSIPGFAYAESNFALSQGVALPIIPDFANFLFDEVFLQ